MIQRCLFLNLGLLCFLLLQSCATVFSGPGPNLSLKGTPNAEKEFKAFEFKESFWRGGHFVKMAEGDRAFTIESVRPMTREISTDAYSKLQSAETWRNYALASCGIAIVTLVGALLSKEGSSQKNAFAITSVAGSGAAITSSFISTYQVFQAAKLYNDELRSKLGLSARQAQSSSRPVLAATLVISFD